MEPLTIAGGGMAIWGSKELLDKLLGPSAEYIGGEVKNFVEKCNINLNDIFDKATKKVGDRINENEKVNPRVLKGVIDDARFCEEAINKEYFAGIIASSRSSNGRDDRGVPLLATIRELSVYQLRLHYLIYYNINKLFNGMPYNLGDGEDCNKMRIFIPFNVYEKALAFEPKENPNAILGHALFGLDKHKLISDFSSGTAEFLHKRIPTLPGGGIVLTPTLPGAELFLWAEGLQGASGRELLQASVTCDIEGFVIENGAVAVTTTQPPSA